MEVFYLNGNDKVNVQNDLKKLPKKKVIWIKMISPSEEEIDDVSKISKIPQSEFKEFIKDEERSRIDYKGYLQIIYQVPIYEGQELITDGMSIFVKDQMVITVSREAIKAIETTAENLKQNKQRYIFRYGVGRCVRYMLDKINDEFKFAVEGIAHSVKIPKSEDIDVQQKMLMKLYNSNVTLIHFKQAVMANLEIMNYLRRNKYKQFNKKDRDKFNDLYYDTLQLMDAEKVQREIIVSAFDFQTIMSSYKLNNFMKKLTSLALIVMIPTFMASMFGMNVIMPYGTHPNGFWIVIGIMAITTLILAIVFKLIDWL